LSNVEMNEDYRDHVTWNAGRHTVILGGDLQWLQILRQQNPFSPRGLFTFDGRFSSLAGELPNVGGISDFADFLLGFPASAARTLAYEDVNLIGATFWSLYAQDDIRLSPNLSLNIGLRYEYRRPPIDKRDAIVSFIPLAPMFSAPGNGALIASIDD